MAVFKDFGSFASLAFSGLLISCFEEWCTQGLQIMSGLINLQNQAAMIITISLVGLLFFIPFSYSLAISALVGSSLGQGDVRNA